MCRVVPLGWLGFEGQYLDIVDVYEAVVELTSCRRVVRRPCLLSPLF